MTRNVLLLVLWLFAAAGAGFAIYGLRLFFRQNAVVFKSSRKLLGTPGDLGLYYEDVFLPIPGGVTVHGWWVPGSGSTRAVMYFPGSIGNISHELSTVAYLASFGVSILIIDYPGFGKSSGRTSERGCYRSADAGWEFLTNKHYRAADIVVFGRSLGATVAAWLASRHDCGVLVCHGAFTSVPDLAARVYPLLPSRYFCYLRFNTRKYIRRCRCPVLVLHARNDTVVPVRHGNLVFAAAPGPRRFLNLAGDHYDNDWQVTPELRMCLTNVLAGKANPWEQSEDGSREGGI